MILGWSWFCVWINFSKGVKYNVGAGVGGSVGWGVDRVFDADIVGGFSDVLVSGLYDEVLNGYSIEFELLVGGEVSPEKVRSSNKCVKDGVSVKVSGSVGWGIDMGVYDWINIDVGGE